MLASAYFLENSPLKGIANDLSARISYREKWRESRTLATSILVFNVERSENRWNRLLFNQDQQFIIH